MSPPAATASTARSGWWRGCVPTPRSRGWPSPPPCWRSRSARTKRPDYVTVSAFLTAALRADCPVAFLNLHQGKVKELDWWHWVTIIALDGRRATLLDSGKELEIDLVLWLETTRRRGGFVAALTGAEG